jgi:microcompartment protein CcmK/EutM
MHVARSWSWADAERLEDEGRLVGEIRDAVNAVLAALEEPLLPELDEGSGARADGSKKQAVDAVVVG